MDINVDQGSPDSGRLGRFENGKYLYRLDDGKFDIDRFNRDFDQYKTMRKQEMAELMQKKLDSLNAPQPEIPPYALSIGQVMINMKDAVFNTLDDIINFNFTRQAFLSDHRLFYLGLFFIIIALLVYFYFIFKTTDIELHNTQIQIKN